MAELERIALFIDGANIYGAAKALGFELDYKRLLREFQGKGRLIRAFYYTALLEEQEYVSLWPLIDWLDYNGYSVVTKAAKEFVDSQGHRKVKGRIDVELAVDALGMADHMDQMYLLSGDGDFRSLVEAVQRKGVRVSVISTVSTHPVMVADELRRQADEFIDLVDLIGKVGRDPAERGSRMLAYQHPVLSNTASDAEMEFSRDSGGGRPPLTPKFTNPETGDTWSGRGPYPPQWVKSVMDARGWTLEDFKGSDEFLSKAPGKY